jgi:hypothetical protein
MSRGLGLGFGMGGVFWGLKVLRKNEGFKMLGGWVYAFAKALLRLITTLILS